MLLIHEERGNPGTPRPRVVESTHGFGPEWNHVPTERQSNRDGDVQLDLFAQMYFEGRTPPQCQRLRYKEEKPVSRPGKSPCREEVGLFRRVPGCVGGKKYSWARPDPLQLVAQGGSLSPPDYPVAVLP